MSTQTITTFPTFASRDEAEAYLQTLPPDAEAVAEFAAQSARHAQAKEDSFDRCDTDGFLSQWASGLASVADSRRADLAEHAGCGVFRCIRRIDTHEIVSTKLFTFQNRFAGWKKDDVWCVPPVAAGRGAGEKPLWLTHNSRTGAKLALLGLELAWMVARGYVAYSDPLDRTPQPRGLSGACSVHSMVLLDRKAEGIEI